MGRATCQYAEQTSNRWNLYTVQELCCRHMDGRFLKYILHEFSRDPVVKVDEVSLSSVRASFWKAFWLAREPPKAVCKVTRTSIMVNYLTRSRICQTLRGCHGLRQFRHCRYSHRDCRLARIARNLVSMLRSVHAAEFIGAVRRWLVTAGS
jgi:hypothetical protein